MARTAPATDLSVDPAPRTGALPPDADVRLVVSDLDGTLLDAHGEVPAGFWPVLRGLLARGVRFVPASGRQYATIARQFATHLDDLVVVAENGAVVVERGEVVSSTPVADELVGEVARHVRALAAGGADVGLVVSGVHGAWVERPDARFVDEVGQYYAALEVVPDLTRVEGPVLKLAAFDFGDAATGLAPALARFADTHTVLVSSPRWVDVMNPAADKGTAVAALQRRWGIGPEHTVVFGDYLNDLGMLARAHHSYAMAEAHPQVRALARHLAPPAHEHGVVQVLSTFLTAPAAPR